MRVNFDVPQAADDPHKITDARRIDSALPAIWHCLRHGARSVVLVSHLGNPRGRTVDRFSLKPVASLLAQSLGVKVTFLRDCVGPDIERACAEPPSGSVILLENVRFHVEEEAEGETATGAAVAADRVQVAAFRASLARLADVYVNAATVGTSERTHSSMVGEGFVTKVNVAP
jgi:phosphoglycerate kinase